MTPLSQVETVYFFFFPLSSLHHADAGDIPKGREAMTNINQPHKATPKPYVGTLPNTGFVRLAQLVADSKTGRPGILPFSSATVWRRVRAGTFPAPVKLSEKVTAWRAEDVRAWLDAQGDQTAPDQSGA